MSDQNTTGIGKKAAAMRAALQETLMHLPDTANEPRHAIRLLMDQPSLVLAIAHDAVIGQYLKGGR